MKKLQRTLRRPAEDLEGGAELLREGVQAGQHLLLVPDRAGAARVAAQPHNVAAVGRRGRVGHERRTEEAEAGGRGAELFVPGFRLFVCSVWVKEKRGMETHTQRSLSLSPFLHSLTRVCGARAASAASRGRQSRCQRRPTASTLPVPL